MQKNSISSSTSALMTYLCTARSFLLKIFKGTGIIDVETDEETDASTEVGVEKRDVANIRWAQVLLHVEVELPVPGVKQSGAP